MLLIYLRLWLKIWWFECSSFHILRHVRYFGQDCATTLYNHFASHFISNRIKVCSETESQVHVLHTRATSDKNAWNIVAASYSYRYYDFPLFLIKICLQELRYSNPMIWNDICNHSASVQNPYLVRYCLGRHNVRKYWNLYTAFIFRQKNVTIPYMGRDEAWWFDFSSATDSNIIFQSSVYVYSPLHFIYNFRIPSFSSIRQLSIAELQASLVLILYKLIQIYVKKSSFSVY